MPSEKKRTSRAAGRESFAFEDLEIRPGKTRTVELPIARLPPGDWSTMPVVVVHGARPGPTVWLSAAVHGDELNGVAIIRRLLQSIEPEQLGGTVLAVPIVNVFGVTAASRYMPDRRDLNRSFPGSVRGSLASRLAHTFFDKVARRCELGIDLHTGSNGRDNLPQVRCDLDDADTARLAHTFGVRLIMHSNLRDGSLRAEACKRGIKFLLYEAGEAHRFDELAIRSGVAGVQRVLAAMGMIDPPEQAPATPAVSRSSRWARAGRSGFSRIHVGLGEEVVEGQKLATITDSVGKKETPVRARGPGIVICILRTALVHRGDALVHVATVDPEPASE